LGRDRGKKGTSVSPRRVRHSNKRIKKTNCRHRLLLKKWEERDTADFPQREGTGRYSGKHRGKDYARGPEGGKFLRKKRQDHSNPVSSKKIEEGVINNEKQLKKKASKS